MATLNATPSRRVARLRGALLVTAAALAAACTAGDRSTTGGTLVIAAPGDADALLPPLAASQLGAQIADLLFPKLATLTTALNTVDDSGFAPVLARRWTRPDSLTLVFDLDERARWQDGVPITAADVAFSFAVYRDTLVGSPYRANLERIAGVTALDSHRVAMQFTRAYPEQLYDGTHHLRVLPRHLLDTIPRARLAASALVRSPLGAGPFRFVRWIPGSQVEVVADSAWWLGRPRLDRIVWRVLPDVTSAVSALLAGEADAMEIVPQLDEIARVRRDTSLRLVPYPSPFVASVVFNLRRPLFHDPALRRALAHGADRSTLVRAVFGPYGEVPPGATSRMQWVADDAIFQLPFDTAAARRLLDSLGWRTMAGAPWRARAGEPLRFTLLVPTTSRVRQQAAVILQSQLRAVGVDMRIQPVDFAVFERRTRAGDFDAAFVNRTLDPSPSVLAQFWSRAAVGGDNIGAYVEPAFDSLVAAATTAPTRAAAAPLWHAALARLNADAPAIHVFSPRNNAVVRGTFGDVTLRPDFWLATVHRWRAAARR